MAKRLRNKSKEQDFLNELTVKLLLLLLGFKETPVTLIP